MEPSRPLWRACLLVSVSVSDLFRGSWHSWCWHITPPTGMHVEVPQFPGPGLAPARVAAWSRDSPARRLKPGLSLDSHGVLTGSTMEGPPSHLSSSHGTHPARGRQLWDWALGPRGFKHRPAALRTAVRGEPLLSGPALCVGRHLGLDPAEGRAASLTSSVVGLGAAWGSLGQHVPNEHTPGPSPTPQRKIKSCRWRASAALPRYRVWLRVISEARGDQKTI